MQIWHTLSLVRTHTHKNHKPSQAYKCLSLSIKTHTGRAGGEMDASVSSDQGRHTIRPKNYIYCSHVNNNKLLTRHPATAQQRYLSIRHFLWCISEKMSHVSQSVQAKCCDFAMTTLFLNVRGDDRLSRPDILFLISFVLFCFFQIKLRKLASVWLKVQRWS